jgi:hypothetical protein
VHDPGRRAFSAREEQVQLKEVNGRPATTRAGAAEHLGIPLGTVRVYSSPGQRHKWGWPEPVLRKGDADSEGKDWFALEDLDTFAASRTQPAAAAPAVPDPDRLLTLAEFGALRGVSRKVMYRYVELSQPDWRRGVDGMLPRPDQTRQARYGRSHLWRYDRAAAWAFPDQPRRSTGRTPGRRPQPQDLQNLLAEPGADKLKNKDLADRLTSRLGTNVTVQTIHRLKRKLRAQGKPDWENGR